MTATNNPKPQTLKQLQAMWLRKWKQPMPDVVAALPLDRVQAAYDIKARGDEFFIPGDSTGHLTASIANSPVDSIPHWDTESNF